MTVDATVERDGGGGLIAQREAKIARAEERVAEESRPRASLLSQVDKLEGSLPRLRNALGNAATPEEADRLQDELDAAYRQLRELKPQLDDAERRARTAKQHLEDARNQLERDRNTLESHRQDLNAAKALVRARRKRRDEFLEFADRIERSSIPQAQREVEASAKRIARYTGELPDVEP